MELPERELEVLRPSLRVLEISGNRLTNDDVAVLGLLTRLKSLDISNNAVIDVTSLEHPLNNLPFLSNLCVAGNPFAADKRARDALVVYGDAVTEIDGKAVLPREREALLNLHIRRMRAAAAKSQGSNGNGKGPSGKGGLEAESSSLSVGAFGRPERAVLRPQASVMGKRFKEERTVLAEKAPPAMSLTQRLHPQARAPTFDRMFAD